jgi:prepilin-type N-terminal cleavage/methylation domain-containing protein
VIQNARQHASGFTLIEMMAVVFLTALVLTAAVDFYLDLSHASNAAAESIVEARRATTLLDRIARDLEGAVLLVKPAEMDPLEHPWVFLGESDSEAEGARRVKFVTRSHRPRADSLHESDLAMISFVAGPGPEGDLILLRSVRTSLPEELDRSFPRLDEDTRSLTRGLAHFGMRFMTEEGEMVSSFDSSTLVHSGQLPLAVEIEVAFGQEDEFGDLEPGTVFGRRVSLPLRPLDLEAELEGGAAGEEGEDDDRSGCITLQQCINFDPNVVMEADLPEDPEVVEGMLDVCVEDLPLGLSEQDCEAP